MRDRRFVFAGGGTGGHLYPGLAVAHALAEQSRETRIGFYTTDRTLDRDLLSRTAFAQTPQTVRPLTLKPWRWPGFFRAWRESVRAACDDFRRDPPAAVLGLGGYAAGPPVVAARALRIPTAILNPDAIPGRANRYLARRVDRVFVQWNESVERLGRLPACRVVGCPIRREFAAARKSEGCSLFKLDPTRPIALATGASQGARTLNDALCAVWPQFLADHPEWQLLHLTGTADEVRCRQAYEAARLDVRLVAFTHDMPQALAAADMVVSRAGASTLAEITALGKPAILLPYPHHRDRHQHANAHVLADVGAAVVLEDERDAERNAPALHSAMRRLADRTTRELMASASRSLGHADAAEVVAAWMLNARR